MRCFGKDAHVHALVHAFTLERHATGDLRKQRVIDADADVRAGAHLRAALAHDDVAREDLRAAQAWIQRYFDARAKASVAALAQLKQLQSASVSFEPPSIADSLEAVRGYKSRRERN